MHIRVHADSSVGGWDLVIMIFISGSNKLKDIQFPVREKNIYYFIRLSIE
jgi:hypothetical protein